MKRKMYWGVALLILLIGTATVFIIQHELAENSKLEVLLYEAQKLADEIKQRKIAENNPPSEEPISKQVQPMANDDVQITDVPIENSQQNDSVETVHVENYLEGLIDIDIFESVTLPTDEELVSYSSGDIMEIHGKLHELDIKLSGIYDKYFKQSLASSDALSTAFRSDDGGAVDQWLNQQTQLTEIWKSLNEQKERLRKEKSRVRQHTRGF